MKKITQLLALSLIIVFTLSACSGGMTASSWPGLSATEDMAYLAYGPYVYGVRLSDGSQAWRYPDKADNKRTFYATPVITPDGQLLVSGFDHALVSLNPQNGVQNWVFNQPRDRLIGNPLVANETIYLPSTDGKLYAIDLKGALKWEFAAKNELWAQPSTDGEKIYIASMDQFLYALDPASGQQIWKTDLGAASVGTPAVGNGSLFIGTLGNEFLAIDAATGTVRWRKPTDGVVWSGPGINGESIYFGDSKGKFYALDAASGNQLWVQQPDGPIIGTPLTTESSVIFSTDNGSLVAVDPQGGLLWNRPIGGKLYTTPVAAGDRYLVAITQSDQLFVALDANGNQLWSFVPPK